MQCNPESAGGGERTPEGGIYVHVPFCRTICPYCDFAVIVDRDRGARVAWREAIAASIGGEAGILRARTVYLGGGTPARLSDEELAGTLEDIRDAFGGDWREATLEANPEDINAGRLKVWRAAGIDRLSVGVQRLDAGHLKRLGRARSAVALRDMPKWVRQWRALGGRLSVDLMYGLPEESPAAFVDELRTVLDWGIDHLSAYALTIEPATPWARAVARGRLAPAEDEVTSACHRAMLGELAARGWDAYEVSNFAAPGRRAVHNAAYWEGRAWLGLGPDAASSLPTAAGPRRFRRPRGFVDWLADPLGRREEEVVDATALVAERLSLGLRSFVGVPAAWLDVWRSAEPDLVTRLESEGAICPGERSGTVVLRPQERLLADEWALRWWTAFDDVSVAAHAPAVATMLE